MANDAVIKLGLDVKGVKAGLDTVQKELKQTAASASKLDRLEKELKESRAEVRKLAAASKDAKKGIKGLAVGFGAVAAGALAIGAAIKGARVALRFAAESVAAAQVQEDAENALSAALERQGVVGDEAAASLRRLASELQQTSRFGDEAIISAQALGLSMGVTADQIGEVSRLAVDMTAALRRSGDPSATLEKTMRQLAQAVGGNVETLGRYIPELRELAKNGATTEEVMALLNEKFAGAAAQDVLTFSGRVQQLKNSWGDLQEEVGFAVTQNEELNDGLGDLKERIVQITPAVAEMASEFFEAAVKVGNFALEVFDALTALDRVDLDNIAEADRPLEEAKIRMRELAAETRTAAEALALLENASGAQRRQMEEQGFTVEGARERLADLQGQVGTLAAEMGELEAERKKLNLKEVGDAARKAAAGVSGLEKASDKASKAAKKLADDLAKITEAAERFGDLAAEVDKLSTETDEQIELLDTLAAGAASAQGSLLRLWLEGRINADQYNERLQAILESEAAIAEQRSAIIAGDRAGFVESIGGGLDAEFKENGEGGSLGQGGFAEFAQGELGAAGQAEQDQFAEENGFQISDVLNPGFDIDTAMENWETVTSAMQDGTMSLVDGQNQLAEAGFKVDGALQAQIKSMAKQGKAAKDVAALNSMFGQAAAQAGGMLIDMAIKGEFSAKKLLKATLTSISQSSKAKAVQELAAGFAALAAHDGGGAALHFKSAAIFGTLAVGAGVAAGAVGGGDEAGDGGRDQPGGPTSRDRDIARTTDAAEEDEPGGPNVSVIFDGASFIGEPTSEQLALITSAVEQATANAGGGNSLRGG